MNIGRANDGWTSSTIDAADRPPRSTADERRSRPMSRRVCDIDGVCDIDAATGR